MAWCVTKWGHMLNVTFNRMGWKWTLHIHFEYSTPGLFILLLPLFAASVLLWFLSLELFNTSVWGAGAGSSAPGSLSDMPLVTVPQHFINKHTFFTEEEIRAGWSAQNAQNAVMLVWHRCGENGSKRQAVQSCYCWVWVTLESGTLTST